MLKILLLPVKLLILPVMLGKLATNISAYVVGLFLLFLLILCVCCLWQHRWTDAAIVAALDAVILILQFGAMFFAEIVGEWAGKLADFLRS